MPRDPTSISKAYTDDSIWRNRDQFIVGTQAIVDLLTAKWEKEKSYRLRKELFAFTDNKIAVQFWYEYQDKHDGMKWKRCYGLEDWTFADDGRMRKRQMSGNDVGLSEEERWFKDGVDVNAVDISEKHW
jgi:nuclear transport factor 2 (NTF2) superfamily protein